eukprot:TRINITY_DN9977_c1_g1_i12.p2 TRINITY_DN9977_c1_g1~~TRINITY_DN9977_c1_g1_i12.p2  ORF type:complete len:104 (+),score=8.85 TRINITY_DN9977_c1_g1_i12:52-363(+)
MADVVARRRRRNYLRRNRIFRDRRHPFDNYDDEELYKKFRFDRRHIIEITDDVTEVLQLANRRLGLQFFKCSSRFVLMQLGHTKMCVVNSLAFRPSTQPNHHQ